MTTHSQDLVSLEELRSVLTTHAGPGDPRQRRDRRGLRRLRKRSRRILLAAAVGATILAIPAVAIALDPTILPWNSAAHAPSVVVHSFTHYNSNAAPPGMNPHVKPGEARTVPLLDGGIVWVAPAAKGGFCDEFAESKAGGCDQTRSHAVNPTAGLVGSFKCGTSISTLIETLPARVEGHVNAQPGSTLELQFSDGTSASLPLTWVSPPINAGFFEQTISAGKRMSALVLRDPGGSLITKDTDIFQAVYSSLPIPLETANPNAQCQLG